MTVDGEGPCGAVLTRLRRRFLPSRNTSGVRGQGPRCHAGAGRGMAGQRSFRKISGAEAITITSRTIWVTETKAGLSPMASARRLISVSPPGA